MRVLDQLLRAKPAAGINRNEAGDWNICAACVCFACNCKHWSFPLSILMTEQLGGAASFRAVVPESLVKRLSPLKPLVAQGPVGCTHVDCASVAQALEWTIAIEASCQWMAEQPG